MSVFPSRGQTQDHYGDEEDEGEYSDAYYFIVDDESRPIADKRKKRKPIFTDATSQEAQDIFGVDFYYEDFEKYGEYEYEEEEEEDEYVDEEGIEESERRRKPKKAARKKPTSSSPTIGHSAFTSEPKGPKDICKISVVMKIYLGRDGKIRVVDVHTAAKEIRKKSSSVNLLPTFAGRTSIT